MPTVFVAYPLEFMNTPTESDILDILGGSENIIKDDIHVNVDKFFDSVIKAKSLVEEIEDYFTDREIHDASVYLE